MATSIASFDMALSHWPRERTRYSDDGSLMLMMEPWQAYFTGARAVVAATWPRLASPCSNCGPHILSQSINMLTNLPIKLLWPYIAQVTTVLSPSGLKVKSTVAVPVIGRFQSIRQRTSSPGLLSTMVELPAPMSLLPSQLHTAPTPESGPL